MKSWNNKLANVLLVFVAVLSFFSFQNSTYAATIGKSLTAPETGWKRYDDTISALKYNGTWARYSNSVYYGGSHQVTSKAGDSVEFEFSGTQLRIIGVLFNQASNNIEISIDGVREYSSMYSSTETVHQAVNYEKKGLTNKVHHVVITNKEPRQLYIDAIDIDEKGSFFDTSIQTPSELIANAGDTRIDLSWKGLKADGPYNIKRSTTSGGPYETIATKVTSTVYTDLNVVNGTEYFYVVTAVFNDLESSYSNEASGIPQAIKSSADRAILTITLTNGLVKEYDISMSEVEDFLHWYDTASATSKYGINKHNNNKGPFTNRKDYVIFDKILIFSVDEYQEVK